MSASAAAGTSLTTRATIFSRTVTVRLAGDRLVRDDGRRCDELPVADIRTVRLWRALRSRGAGGQLEVRLETAERTWRLSSHHAHRPFAVQHRDAALVDLLAAIVRVRDAMPPALCCRIGSNSQWIAGLLLAVLTVLVFVTVVVAIAWHATTVSLSLREWTTVTFVLVVIGAFAVLARRTMRHGRGEVVDGDALLRHPLMAPPAGTPDALLRDLERLMARIDAHGG